MNRRNMKARIALLEGVLAEQGISLLEDGNFYKTKYEGQEVIGFFKEGVLVVFNPRSSTFSEISAGEVEQAVVSITYPEIITHFGLVFKIKGITPGAVVAGTDGNYKINPEESWKKPFEIEVRRGLIYYRGTLIVNFLNQTFRKVVPKVEIGDILALVSPFDGSKSIIKITAEMLDNMWQLKQLGVAYQVHKVGTQGYNAINNILETYTKNL